MKNIISRFKTGGILLIFVLASCALPGRSSSPKPANTPNPTENSMVETAQALLKQTKQAPGTSTPTIVPTETLTPMPVFSSYGTALMKHEDSAVTFIDERAKMQIVFPSNWLALRVGEPEYYQAWEKEGVQNPDLLDAITAIQNLDLNRFRISAFDMHPEHALYGNLPKINVVFIPGDTRTLQRVDFDERNRSSVLAGYKVLPSEFKKTSTGIDILIVQYQWESTQTSSYTSYYKGILFKVPNGTVAVDLFIPMDVKEALEQELDQIIESLTILDS